MEYTYIINNKGVVATVHPKVAKRVVGSAQANQEERRSGNTKEPRNRFNLDGWRYASEAEAKWLAEQYRKNKVHPVRIDIAAAHTAKVSETLSRAQADLAESERKRQLLEAQMAELMKAKEEAPKPKTRGRKPRQPKTDGGEA